MSVGARLNGRVTQLAVGRHLPHRTARVRLTLLYGGLFLISGAVLMAITYALLVNAGFVFTLNNGPGNVNAPPATSTVKALPAGFARGDAAVGNAVLRSTTNPSAQTMAHWQGVAQCMRRHGVAGFPNPATSVPRDLSVIGEVADRDGAMFAIPASVLQSTAFVPATTACGFMPDRTGGTAQANRRRAQTRQELLIQSGIALAGMSLLSLGLGWLMAGRVLQPLERSYEAQRQFVANASHELRAPLTRQRALIEVALASSEADADSLRRAHERVLASEQHLEQLIDALLALTRGQAGLERRQHLDLAALTSRAILARQTELEGGELDVRATLDPAPTAGDPRLLDRLISNLIDNAMRHNSPGGQVEITTGSRERHGFVSIANTGPTVPPEEIERLFEPFQRLGEARTRHNNGHGLGLSIVRAVAKAHHAELSALARPDGGLTIEVSFPPANGSDSKVTPAAAWARRGHPRAVSETDIPAGS
jgi:signal transduction histidine kinase